MPKSQVPEKGIRYSYRMSIVIPFPGITIHFLLFLDAPSGDYFWALKSQIRYRFVIHARGQTLPFLTYKGHSTTK